MLEPTVWRIHLKTEGRAFCSSVSKETPDYYKLFMFCREKGIIGVGWSKYSTRLEKEEDLRSHTPDTKSFKALNAMRQMKAGDLIWTRSIKQVYYLCRVVKPWLDTVPDNEKHEYDIANFCEVEWLEIGTEDTVPGKVAAAFRPSAAIQRIHDVNLITRNLWNKYSGAALYPILATKAESVWDFLHSSQVEELVLLYLQVNKGLRVYTSTVKHDEARFECIMVDSEGNLVYPQVKSGNTPLKSEEYRDIVERDSSAMVYLFASNQQYGVFQHERINCITEGELQEFIQHHMKLLPTITREWLRLYTELHQSW